MSGLGSILAAFLADGDWSIASARGLEHRLDAYADLDGVPALLDVLASYRPGGGDYLFDQRDLERTIRSLLPSTQPRP